MHDQVYCWVYTFAYLQIYNKRVYKYCIGYAETYMQIIR